ncbi:MAG: trehalose-6-phosphate synthase [Chloroflexi bacterium]|nr:trehalose-6-phosphate synthase [Chloroflexota bacterium]
MTQENNSHHLMGLEEKLFAQRSLIIAANRGPVKFDINENGELQYQRNTGGLVTALLGLLQYVDATWISCANTESDRLFGRGDVVLGDGARETHMVFLSPDPQAYEGYYGVISNPLLWFLQHSMWDLPRNPVIDHATWEAWEGGYKRVNQLFADEIIRQIHASPKTPVVMLQDYHLYLAARSVRDQMEPLDKTAIMHFTHIPWPGPEYWRFLPPTMRQAILDGLCAADILGFQTQTDSLNFIRTCESFLPQSHQNFKRGWVWYRNHTTHVRDFPISVDVNMLEEAAKTLQEDEFGAEIDNVVKDMQLVVRVDRMEPSKNIIRGFQAFEEMLGLYPDMHGKVVLLALLVPSRSDVSEYQDYQDNLMAAAGRVNTRFGSRRWEPVRVLIGDDYARGLAALQRYDVLLVNSLADGMNLVAKEGPIVNQKNGVLVLSESTGASQQLGVGAIVISPIDVYATAQALHQALTMPLAERKERATRLRWTIEREDIMYWLYQQLQTVVDLNL